MIIDSGIGLLRAVEAASWEPRPQLYGVLDLYVAPVLAAGPTIAPGMILAGAQPITDAGACAVLQAIEAEHPGTIGALGSNYTWTTYQSGLLMASLTVDHQGDVERIVQALSTRTFKDSARLSRVHGGHLYFGDDVFAKGLDTFPFVVRSDLSVSPHSCP